MVSPVAQSVLLTMLRTVPIRSDHPINARLRPLIKSQIILAEMRQNEWMNEWLIEWMNEWCVWMLWWWALYGMTVVRNSDLGSSFLSRFTSDIPRGIN